MSGLMFNVHFGILSNIKFKFSGYVTNDTYTVHIRDLEQFTNYHWYCPHQVFGTLYQLLLILSISDVWNSFLVTTDSIQMFGTVYQLPLTLFIQIFGTVYQMPLTSRRLEQFTSYY